MCVCVLCVFICYHSNRCCSNVGTNGIRTIQHIEDFVLMDFAKTFLFKSCGNHVEVIIMVIDMAKYCPFPFVFKISQKADVSAVSGRSIEPGSLCDWLRHDFGNEHKWYSL